MAAAKLPAEIARETLRKLTQRRVAPTPDRYAEVYCEIAGEGETAAVAAPRALEKFASELAVTDGSRGIAGRNLAVALSEGRWEDVQRQLTVVSQGDAAPPDWAALVRNLVKQLSLRHSGITDARKREMIEHVLTAFGTDAAKLHARLGNVLKSWRGEATPKPELSVMTVSQPIELAQNMGASAAQPVKPGPALSLVPNTGKEAERKLLQLVADTLDKALVERLQHSPKLAEEAMTLAHSARQIQTAQDVERLAQGLHDFWYHFEMSGDSPDRVAAGLSALLRLVVDNMEQLVVDDGWIVGQMETLKGVLEAPVNERVLREAERSFRRVLFRQANVKHSLDQAKDALKTMLTGFIDRLGSMAVNTGLYQERIAGYAEELAATEDVERIGEIAARLAHETRTMHTDIQRNYDELDNARKQAAEHESKAQALERELASISALVREDTLTRALNRRGLSEAFVAESSRSSRKKSTLCLAILDVDDFKVLNDRYGHATGDQALVHLTNVVRNALRPSDIVARYGGEEFVILLPDTRLEEAVEAMRRAQRELTRHFFLHDNERLLITFSAGVTLWLGSGEDQDSTLDRADAALYRAKRAGKNRVMSDLDLPR